MAKKDHLGSAVIFYLAMVGAAVVLLVAGAAMAEHMICEDRRSVVEQLETTYGEQTVSVGLMNSGYVIETLASPSGSFTVLMVSPDGLACVMAAGEDFEPRPVKPDLGT